MRCLSQDRSQIRPICKSTCDGLCFAWRWCNKNCTSKNVGLVGLVLVSSQSLKWGQHGPGHDIVSVVNCASMTKQKTECFSAVPKGNKVILHLKQNTTGSLSQGSDPPFSDGRMSSCGKLLNGTLENREVLQELLPQSSHVSLSVACKQAIFVGQTEMHQPMRHACNNCFPGPISTHTTNSKRL